MKNTLLTLLFIGTVSVGCSPPKPKLKIGDKFYFKPDGLDYELQHFVVLGLNDEGVAAKSVEGFKYIRYSDINETFVKDTVK